MTDDDTVPGMAAAIERRRKMLGLSPGEMVAASGLSHTALANVRAGRRRQYQTKLTRQVAQMLRWPLDWYDRLLAGEEPESWPEPPMTARSPELGWVSGRDVVRLLRERGLSEADAIAEVHRLLDESSPPERREAQPRVPGGHPQG